jgi:hypothetical protein
MGFWELHTTHVMKSMPSCLITPVPFAPKLQATNVGTHQHQSQHRVSRLRTVAGDDAQHERGAQVDQHRAGHVPEAAIKCMQRRESSRHSNGTRVVR